MGRIFVIKEKVGRVGGEQGKKKRKAGGEGQGVNIAFERNRERATHQRRELVLDSSIR